MKKKLSSWFSSPVVIIFLIYVAVACLTYIIPSGEYVRRLNEATGITEIQGDSFLYVDNQYMNFMDFFRGIHEGFVDASDIIFMCFFSCFYIRVINEAGAFDAGIGALIKRFGANSKYMLPIIIVVVSLAGYSYGEAEDIYPLIPLFVATAIKVGYDDVMGVAISGGAVMIGFSASAFNPYTIGVAQKIAELPLYSGALLRTGIYVVFIALYIWWVMRYGKKLLLQGAGGNGFLAANQEGRNLQKAEAQEFTTKHKFILLGFMAVVFMMIFGALKFGWYFTEISALFIIGALGTCVFQRYSPTKTVQLLLGGMQDILIGATVIGLARGILVIMTKALVIDTVVYGLFNAVQMLPRFFFPVGMLIVQTILNFAIPSGSGQAATIMPIMVPLADLLNVNRQVGVLAFQMGDGFSNLIWPTAAVSVMCSIAKVPLQRWYKFFVPFFLILFALMCVILVMADWLNYGPF